jgi:hypothetical protein
VRKVLNDEVPLSDEEVITHNHVILPCSRLYTLISIFLDANHQHILGSDPVVWEPDNTGHSLVQSIIV